MENVKVMLNLRIVCFSLVVLMVSASMSYAGSSTVSMRSSKEPGKIRLVFESEQEIIKKAKVYHSYTLVKIEFPSEFRFDAVKTPETVEISQKEKSLFVNIGGLKDLKVFRLSGPPRLVIDANVEKAAVKKAKPEEPEEELKLSGLQLMIDPGHGGYDIGLVGGDYKEKDVVLSIARSLHYAAKKAGAEVSLTRYSDKYITINERIRVAYEKRPELFVSIHMSSMPDFVVYYAKMEPEALIQNKYALQSRQSRYLKLSRVFAGKIADELQKRFKRAVTLRQMALPILTSADAPAIALEIPDGRFFDYNSANRGAMVSSILKGIMDYER